LPCGALSACAPARRRSPPARAERRGAPPSRPGRAACRARHGGGHVTPVLPTVPARPVAPGDSAGAEERTCHPRGEGRSNLRHPREECLRPRGGVPLPWPTFDTARAAALREMREDVSMSKHSTHATRTLKPSPLRRGLARTAVTLAGGAVVATGMIATGTAANAAGGWDEVAACESGGDWSINTGNGYYGGLQFSQQTWEGYGGTQYAATADQASKSQQIAIGEKVLAGQGAGAWPTC